MLRAFIIGILLACSLVSSAQDRSLDVSRAGNTYVVPLRTKGSIEQVDIATLCDALAIAVNLDSNGKCLTVDLPQAIAMREGNPFVRYGSKIQQLPLPVERVGHAYWVPLEWAVDRLTSQGIEEVDFDKVRHTLALRPGKIVWRNATVSGEGSNILRIEIALPPGPIVDTEVTDSAFVIKVSGARVDTSLKVDCPPSLASVQYRLEDEPPAIAIYPSGRIDSIQTVTNRTWRIMMKSTSTNMPTTSIPTLPVTTEKGVPVGKSNESKIDDARKRWKVDCIVLDAGHGGKDPGAMHNKLKEKDLTLDIVLRLAELLRKETGLRVVLTRDKDEFIPLQDRGKIANRENGKLFVSVHINASKNTRLSGTECFFLSPAKTPRALEVAKFENEVVKLEADANAYQSFDDERLILLSMAQAQYLKESQQIAEVALKESVRLTRLPDLGVDQAGFYVLVGASMPAILFECAFISNDRDATVLREPDERQKFADALRTAILKFRDSSE